jgi:ribosomal subunit interface protein
MKHNIEYLHFEPKAPISTLVESWIAKLERKAGNFSPDLVFLRILIEQNKARMLCHISITMEVPGKTLVAREETHDIEVAIKKAFAEIERQLREHKSKLRGEHLWKRLSNRAELRRLKISAEPSEQRTREIFFSLVSPHIDKLEHLVRHMIRSFEAEGDLVRGELDTQDVVDDTLVQTYQEFLKGYPSQDIRSWLILHATDVLDTEAATRNRDRERMVHIEEDVPETPPTMEVSTLGDEILDFYQPDEDLKVEDIVPDLEVPTAEQMAETKELQQLVRSLLAQMPREWRRALLLHDLGGQKEANVAKAIGKPEMDIGRILEQARDYLRTKLIDYGYGFKRAA